MTDKNDEQLYHCPGCMYRVTWGELKTTNDIPCPRCAEFTLSQFVAIVMAPNKQETIQEFDDRCFTTLKCEMCGEKLQDWADAPHVAEMAYSRGWRFQKDMVLCQQCTDDKR